MIMKRLLISIVSAGLAGGLFAAMPSVSDVTLAQDAESGVVTASYTLAGAPAIVTLEILTNGVPIKGSAIVTVEGAANRLLDKDGSYSFTWLADRDVEGLFDTTVTARMSAWRPEDPPDYLVADLITPSNVTYYASADDLPHGVQHFANKTTRLVMRRIRAAGVSWAMGSVGETGRAVANEMVHAVTLAADYWIGVFEITQAQWAALRGGERPSAFKDEGDWAERPVEMVTPAVIRESADYAGNSAYYYPAAPHPDSFLGLLRAKTGIDFDLPGEAQWEYACRAGTGEGVFNNGYVYWEGIGVDKYSNPNCKFAFPGRVRNPTGGYPNGGGDISYAYTADGVDSGYSALENGTARVGWYEPNAWGLYDMHGNVGEWCLDWFANDITALNGTINANGAKLVSDPSADGVTRVLRGGHWDVNLSSVRSAFRESQSVTLVRNYTNTDNRSFAKCGLRVVCPLTLTTDEE